MITRKENTSKLSLPEKGERMVEDLQSIISNARNIAKQAKADSDDMLEEKTRSARASLRSGVDKVRTYRNHARDAVTDYSKGIDDKVCENPWRTAAIAALGGFALSLFFSRR